MATQRNNFLPDANYWSKSSSQEWAKDPKRKEPLYAASFTKCQNQHQHEPCHSRNSFLEFLLLTHSSGGVYTPPNLSDSLNPKHLDGETPGVRFHIGSTAHFRTLSTESGGGLVATVMPAILLDKNGAGWHHSGRTQSLPEHFNKEGSGVVNKRQWMERLDRIHLNGTQKVYSRTLRGFWGSHQGGAEPVFCCTKWKISVTNPWTARPHD